MVQKLGSKTQVNHDNRYDIADEYLEVLYKLWEGSWEEGSVLRDRESGILLTIKVHPIQHEGKYFTVPASIFVSHHRSEHQYFIKRGIFTRQKFASQNAECVFIAAPSKIATKKWYRAFAKNWLKEGRDPYSVKIYALLSIVTDETDAKAQAKFKEYQSYGSYDGALTLLSGWSGVDFSQYQPTDKVEYIQTNAIQSLLDSYVNADPERVWTIEEIANWNSLGGNGPVLVGSAETVSDALQQWVEDTDVDGFNLAYILAHQTFADVVEFIVPELQKRGVYQTSYTQGTLREKLFGAGPYLPENHRGAKYRNLKELKLAEAS